MNKPKCLVQMSPADMQGILNGDNVLLPRADIAALVLWAIFQENQSHERFTKNVRFGAPATLEEALVMMDSLEDKITQLEDKLEDMQSKPVWLD